MALRKILTKGDEQLAKHCRPVEKFDDRLHVLIDDMRETLENSGGVGLAAPQVGIWAKSRAQGRFGNWFEREGEGVVAQCFCHETEHLDGHLFIEKVEEYVDLEQMQDGEEE